MIGSLCSGYGGLDMAVSALTGMDVAWHFEVDPNASRILEHHWPDVPNHGDLTAVDWSQITPVDVLTAGYPCQPFSTAGRRQGTNDVRHIWPHILDALRVLRPRCAVFENVAGHLSLGFDTVLADLAEIGFDAEWALVRASDAGACHRRERLFVLACDTDGMAGAPPFAVGGRPGAVAEPGTITRTVGSDRLAANGDAAPDAEGHEQREPAERGLHKPGRSPATSPDTYGTGPQGRCWDNLAPRESETATHDRRTPTDASSAGLGEHPAGAPTQEARPGSGHVAGDHGGERPAGEWGPYHAAVTRWANVIGRTAPEPTIAGRLSPRFVEWMMGLPAGWVTDVPGLSRTAQLKALGNGVVPAQAELALAHLIGRRA